MVKSAVMAFSAMFTFVMKWKFRGSFKSCCFIEIIYWQNTIFRLKWNLQKYITDSEKSNIPRCMIIIIIIWIIFKGRWEEFCSAIESTINRVFLNYTVVSLMWQNQKMLLIARYNVKVSENLTGSFSQNLEENFFAEVIQLIWPLKCSRRKAWPLLDLICKTVFIINWNLVVVFSSSVNFLAGFQRQLQFLWGMYVPIVKPLYLNVYLQ